MRPSSCPIHSHLTCTTRKQDAAMTTYLSHYNVNKIKSCTRRTQNAAVTTFLSYYNVNKITRIKKQFHEAHLDLSATHNSKEIINSKLKTYSRLN